MAKLFQTNVMWDLSITDIEATNSSYAPLDLQGLITHASKVSGTVPDAVSGKYAPGATIQNLATGVWYRNTGNTVSPVWTIWPI